MVLVSELDLPHLPIGSAEFGRDPMPFMADAHARHDWLAATDIGYLVTRYRAIEDIMRLDGTLKMPGEEIARIMGAEGTGWGDFAVEQMLVSSGERHSRLRGSVAAAFRPGSVKRLRSIMRETVLKLLDEWTARGEFDFAEFAANFPVRVMFALIGASDERLPEIMRSLEIHGQSFNLEVEKMAIIEDGYQTLWGFVDGLIEERGRDAGRGDLLDDLIAANSAGELNDKELRQMLLLLFAAGYDTTKNLLTLLMHSMVQNPEVYARCADDPDYARKVVKEQLRFATPSNTYRIVVDAFEYRGVTFPADTMLIFPLSISGRDPEVFAAPMRFDPERTERAPSQAFGRGMHICLGQFLALANVEEGIHAIAQRIARPRVAGEVTWRPFPGVWGISALPIAFDAVAATPAPVA
jgi:cytochrome P450